VVETIPVPNIAVTTGDTIAFYGQGIPVDDLGTGADTLSYPAPALPGATVTLGGVDFPIFSQTRTYSFGANVLDTSAVVPVVDATATAYGGVDAVAIVDGGSGYTFPTVEFGLPDGPGGVQATGHADMNANGTITAVMVDSAGSGYSAAPVVTIHNGTSIPTRSYRVGSRCGNIHLTLRVWLEQLWLRLCFWPTVQPTIPWPGRARALQQSVADLSKTSLLTRRHWLHDAGHWAFVDGYRPCAPPACPHYQVEPIAKYVLPAVPEPKATASRRMNT
jgi:hypothetical protein